jgi:hypothetical protein
MKKNILFTAIALSALTIKAQESSSKLKLHAATLGFGGFSFKKANYEGGGATFFADLTTSLDKNLISVSYLTGAEIGIIGGSNYQFHEYSLLYGRELKVANWLRFEGFAGLGYYHQQTDYLNPDYENVPEGKSVSFPLRINTKFYFSKKFGMGFNTNYSINSVNNNFSTNLIFHYRFN